MLDSLDHSLCNTFVLFIFYCLVNYSENLWKHEAINPNFIAQNDKLDRTKLTRQKGTKNKDVFLIRSR